jgi:hypothetical protein
LPFVIVVHAQEASHMRTFTLALCCALALLAPGVAAAQTPANLTGEVLSGTANPTLGLGAVAVDCQPAGTSTVTYTVEGPAAGPYVGTFEESGSYTIVNGQVDSFEATFTIDAGATQVVGTKTLRESLSAQCVPTPELGIEDFTDVLLNADYEATITSPTGTLVDRGRATVAAQLSTLTTGAAGAAVQEAFDSEDLIHTPGHVSGAGLIEDALHGHVVFGFTAKSDGVTARAKCAVATYGTLVTCQNATLLMQVGTHVTFLGQAHVNGTQTDYRIDVDDLGEPGRDRDTFTIQTNDGFLATGVLRAGNIQIHY